MIAVDAGAWARALAAIAEHLDRPLVTPAKRLARAATNLDVEVSIAQ